MAGIYIHIPFCKKRCIYCDFFSTTQSEKKAAYIEALCRELILCKDYIGNERVETIYLGGGTPSQLADSLPIVCPIGMDENYDSYNINADDAACAIARAVHAEKLAFLTDIEGVYKDPKDPSTLISELPISEAKKLIEDGYIGGGMLPKLNNCIDAIENGVSRVHILDGRIAHCLLLEIFTNRGIGTAILGDKETKYYHE